jgi:NTP pyrophosphatase (non-canonical NTP hydrolase)
MESPLHASDCAVHNGPAYPPGPCNCGAVPVPRPVDWPEDRDSVRLNLCTQCELTFQGNRDRTQCRVCASTHDLDVFAQWAEGMWFATGSKELGESDLFIMALGLAGETGEVMELLKKRTRDGTFDRAALVKELGDVVYYWARICSFFGIKPSEVLYAIRAKLEDRRARGVLRGSGDDR